MNQMKFNHLRRAIAFVIKTFIGCMAAAAALTTATQRQRALCNIAADCRAIYCRMNYAVASLNL